MSTETEEVESLEKEISALSIRVRQDFVFLCDLQYGFPKERRPRREKICAIAKQLGNFLDWQTEYCNGKRKPVSLNLVHHEEDADAVLDILNRLFPNSTDHERPSSTVANGITATCKPLDQVVGDLPGSVLYLSPDANDILHPNTLNKDDIVSGFVIGGIIDRKHIQENRSLSRAEELGIGAVRWPLPGDWNQHEPLNVDCILQGMQDWIWTENLNESIAQALATHVRRHPGRPKHKR